MKIKMRDTATGALDSVETADLPTVKVIPAESDLDKLLLGMWQRIAEPGATVELVTRPKEGKRGYSAKVVCMKPGFWPALFHARINHPGNGKITLRKRGLVNVRTS